MGTLSKELQQGLVTGALLVFLAHVCLSVLYNKNVLVILGKITGLSEPVLGTETDGHETEKNLILPPNAFSNSRSTQGQTPKSTGFHSAD